MTSEAGMSSQLPELETRRAYEADAVDRYVTQLHGRLAELQRRLEEALRLARDAEQRSGVMENAEILLGRALLRAQRMADEIVEDAHRRAELIIAEAQREANDTITSVRQDAEQIINEADQTVESVFASLQRPPPPAQREPSGPGPWQGPSTMSPEPDEPPARVVDFRVRNQFRNSSVPPARYARTGTDGGLVVAPSVAVEPENEGWPHGLVLTAHSDGGVALPSSADLNIAGPVPHDERSAGLAMLRERWRVARSGPSALDDDLLSRSGHWESLADGSYVGELRSGAIGMAPTSSGEVPGSLTGSRRQRRLFRRYAKAEF